MNCVSQIYAHRDGCYIHFLATTENKGFLKTLKDFDYKIYINDRLLTSVSGLEELKVKIYSKGRLTVNCIANGVNQGSATIDVTDGRDHYVARHYTMNTANLKQSFYKEVDSITWVSYIPSIIKTIEEEEDKNDPYGKLDESIKSGKGQGTCFAIIGSYVVTNFHVIDNAKEITVRGIDGDFSTKYVASVVASDKTNDLAILKINNKNVKFEDVPYVIKTSGIQQGDKVYAMGFPIAVAMGNEVKLTDGIISAKSGVVGDISKFQISAAVNHGNSGGPLIDEQGDVIGVIYAKSTLAESAGYAIKAAYLETFLKNVDGFEYPTLVNKLKDKPLADKIAEWKKYIFIVETN